MNRTPKYHLYPNDKPDELEKEDGFGLTACGRKGKIVGGLISGFFKKAKIGKRCKTCNKIYNRENKK